MAKAAPLPSPTADRTQPSGSEPAVASVRAFIADGGYGPGDRLPPERELVARLGITRTALRRAFEVLEREGLIWRHVGKGTFLAAARPAAADAVPRLARQTTPFKMMRARLTIEPALAREAAVNASDEALARLDLANERARAAQTWQDYEVEDDRFHRAVAEAADNLALLAIFDQLNAIRRAVAWGNVTRSTARPAPDHPSFAEHRRIADAIAGRGPDAAEGAMRRHLKSVEARLFGE